jgi:AraC-like DNA-binding protein
MAAMTLHALERDASKPAVPSPVAVEDKTLRVGDACRDPLLEPLVRSILPPDEASDVLRGFYTSAFHAKLLQRLEHLRNQSAASAVSSTGAALQPWRLKRISIFIDQNIDQPLSLDCLSRAVGLSRMHFAALFRRATGLRPHDYVMQRRMERAKQLLSESSMPIVEIAFCVGFQSQSHFTTVFKRAVGTTPNGWRLMRDAGDLAA